MIAQEFLRAQQTLSELKCRLTSALLKERTTIEGLEQEQQQVLSILESLVDGQYYRLENVTNLHNIEEQLSNRADQGRRTRDVALKIKQERKEAKVEFTAKVEQLKAEMSKLNEDNCIIQKKLTDESQLPLVCRLMRTTE